MFLNREIGSLDHKLCICETLYKYISSLHRWLILREISINKDKKLGVYIFLWYFQLEIDFKDNKILNCVMAENMVAKEN